MTADTRPQVSHSDASDPYMTPVDKRFGDKLRPVDTSESQNLQPEGQTTKRPIDFRGKALSPDMPQKRPKLQDSFTQTDLKAVDTRAMNQQFAEGHHRHYEDVQGLDFAH